MSNGDLDDSNVSASGFLNGVNDPPLNEVDNAMNNVLNENNGVGGEQIGIRELAEQIEGLMRRMTDREAVIFERILSLEQNSSRGSQSSSTGSVAARPGDNRFGVISDQSGGNLVQNPLAVVNNSPNYSNQTEPSDANSNSSGPEADSRHGDRSPSNKNGQSAPNNSTGSYADPQNTRGRTEHLNYSASRRY